MCPQVRTGFAVFAESRTRTRAVLLQYFDGNITFSNIMLFENVTISSQSIARGRRHVLLGTLSFRFLDISKYITFNLLRNRNFVDLHR